MQEHILAQYKEVFMSLIRIAIWPIHKLEMSIGIVMSMVGLSIQGIIG
jgi:hypothetical protein